MPGSGVILMNKVHYSSKQNDWETPQDLYDLLHAEFSFNLDVCALPDNAKCDRYFTPDDDGLAQDWSGFRCWMNPPYGRQIGQWMKKAYDASQAGGLVVCLVPARVDTGWWWNYAIRGEIRFLRGRLKFGGAKNGAPFPSAVVIFSRQHAPAVKWWHPVKVAA